MWPMFELEIKSMASRLLLNPNTLGLSVMLHDQLLQVQKCSLVINFLSHLNLGLPVMRSVSFFAIITLIVLDHKFNHDGLLNGCSSFNFLLHCHLNLKSFRMGFRPQKSGVDQLHSLEPFHLLEAKGEQFRGLQLEMHPWRSQIPVTLPTMRKIYLSWNSLSDVDLCLKTVHASGLALDSDNQNTAHAASDLVCLHHVWINISIVSNFFCWFSWTTLIFCDLNVMHWGSTNWLK